MQLILVHILQILVRTYQNRTISNKARLKMTGKVDLVKDAAMILGGLSYYVAGTAYILSKLAADYSLTLM